MSDTDQIPPLPRKVALPPPKFQTMRVVIALILREMGSTYGRSPGGYLWAVLSPVAVISLLALAFSLVVHKPALGTSFLLFYATGYLPFDMTMGLSGVMASSITYSRPLLAYPRVTWIDSVLARFTLNVLTKITVFCIVMTGILMSGDAHTVLDVRLVAIGLSMGAALGLGIGLMNCMLIGHFPVWARIWAILSRPLFLASGVVFILEDLPRNVRELLAWNPIAHVIATVRTGFYPTYYASFVSLSYCFAIALTLIAVALVFLRRGYMKSLER